MMRVSYDTMYAEFVRVLEKRGFTQDVYKRQV